MKLERRLQRFDILKAPNLDIVHAALWPVGISFLTNHKQLVKLPMVVTSAEMSTEDLTMEEIILLRYKLNFSDLLTF